MVCRNFRQTTQYGALEGKTQSLQSASQKVQKLSEIQECLAKKLVKSGFFLYLTPKLSGISEKIFKFAFKYNILQRMEDRELLQKSAPEFERLAFTVLAIEASAQKMGISPSEMRKRLDKVGLIKSLIQDCYDTLHTESREAVANDVVEALKNWERKE